MTQWLIDTFVWTGALIAAVLVLRRPVARHFGPQVAYALWALPLLRFVLPPLVLPASMAPAPDLAGAAMAADLGGTEATMVPVAYLAAEATPVTVVDWSLLLGALWLGGAMAFLGWRLQQYRTMRADLLAAARPVGEVGRVRLVETPAVTAPVAFGVRDKVVALPPQFMAQSDRAARDLAIAHELAHHRGHDLLANILAQPLLALHWFNPLAWAGWRAMRRDQEAACDARVVAGCDRDEKVTYARVIAGFATGRHLALAAPMACPMAGSLLGEKSIIHRLRSLTMADVSAARRKLGLATIAGTALLALPLTASISYAQADAPDAPDAPEAPQVGRHMVIVDSPEGSEIDDPALHSREVRRPDGMVIVLRTTRPVSDAEAQERVDRALASIPEDEADLAEAEIEEAMADARESMAEAREAMAEHQAAMTEHRQALASIPRFEMACEGNEMVRERVDADGRKVIVMCRRAVQASATQGLRQAQRAVRTAPGIPEDQRQRIIQDLEEQISRLDREELSHNVAPVPPVPPVAPMPPVAPVAYPVASVRVEVKAQKAPPPEASQPIVFAPVAFWLSGGELVFGTVIS
jgi:beta-lactamase regulating signal transducer with metallopeptidase domain